MSLAPTGRRARRRAFVPAVAFAAVAAIVPAALLPAPARNPSATTTQKYQAMRAAGRIQQEKDDALRSFLNKDQWKSYKQQKEQMEEMMQEAWRQGGAP